jgi:putative ATPase
MCVGKYSEYSSHYYHPKVMTTHLTMTNPTFSSTQHQWPQIPLAEIMRPKNLEEMVGQEHILGKNKSLKIALEAKQIHSMILWGPPGVGKTSLARLMAFETDYHFIALSAVLAGVKDIRQAITEAEDVFAHSQNKTILFIDEIHRFNKGQQDALLPFVESGLLTFIGATTENPSFEVNSALLSRSHTYVLRPLQSDELLDLIARIPTKIPKNFDISDEAKKILIEFADGDARRLFNMIDQASTGQQHNTTIVIDATLLKNTLNTQGRRFDKGGDYFYDQISALHKSVRGSSPDAALYWLCRMLDGGTDPLYLGRRIIRMAWEDIGLADPRAIQICLDAVNTYERLGSPEGELALGVAVVYLAVAAKSNAAYQAYNQAKEFVNEDQSQAVPLHLRNAPTNLMKKLGHGHAYRYAHDEPNAYAAGESYLPDHMQEPHWYQPTDRGLEIQIKEKMAFLRSLDEKAVAKK